LGPGWLTAPLSWADVINRTQTDLDLQSLPKNTDGFDTYNVRRLTVTNTEVNIGDDCFSPKPNTSDIFVQNLWCDGTHGVSMGSIGQYPGVLDIIEDAYIENVTLLNGQVR
jgi:galacturan 1,4-alpha-galacturonidase